MGKNSAGVKSDCLVALTIYFNLNLKMPINYNYLLTKWGEICSK